MILSLHERFYHSMNYPDLISIQRASTVLGVSRTQVYRLMKNNILVEVSVGDKIMILRDSVDRYLQLKTRLTQLKQEMLQPFPA